MKRLLVLMTILILAALGVEFRFVLGSFLAHISWNTANGEAPTKDWIETIRSQLMYNGKIPSIFQSKNEKAIIKLMTNFKNKVYPEDQRIIEACGYINGKVQATWKD